MNWLFWIWLGGMAPVALVAWADYRFGRPDDFPVWARIVSVVLWPVFVVDATIGLALGKLK